MDTWKDRKLSNRKFPSKSEKSYHAHLKQVILPSIIFEFPWLVIDGFMKENGQAPPSPKKDPPHKKIFLWEWGEYIS